MEGGPITVLSSVDAAFLPLIGPVAASMAHFASPERPIHYRVLYEGPMSADVRALDGHVTGPVTIHLMDPPATFEKLRGRSRMGVPALARLAAAELMPEITKLLYLDADLLVRADIGDLVDTDLKGGPVGAVVDFSLYAWLDRQRREPPTERIHDIDHLLRQTIGYTQSNWYTYKNTGVLVMDLAALRKEEFGPKALTLLEQRIEEFPWSDQDCINILLKDRLTVLDPRWNVLALTLTGRGADDLGHEIASGIHEQRRRRSIFHFSGPAKPWRRTAHIPHSGEWWHFAEQSPTFATIESRYRAYLRDRRRPMNPVTAVAWKLARLRLGRAGAVRV